MSCICKRLESIPSVVITWFPGHHDNPNIPSADNLAKAASTLPLPPVNITYTWVEASCVLDEWIGEMWNKEWQTHPTCSYQRMFSVHKGTGNFCKTRRLDTAISRLRLMQTKLNAGKFKIGLHSDGLCETCGVLKDGIHFLIECVETTTLREKLKEITERLNLKWGYADLLNNQGTINEIAKYIIENDIEI